MGDFMKDEIVKRKVKAGRLKSRPAVLNLALCLSAVLCVVSLAVTLKVQLKSSEEIKKYENANTRENYVENLSGNKTNELLGDFVIITSVTENTEISAAAENNDPLSAKEDNPAVNTQQNRNAETVKKNITTETKTTTKKHTTTVTEKITELDAVLIINKKSKKIHSSVCPYAEKISGENRYETTGDRLQTYIDNGYSLCSHCKACK